MPNINITYKLANKVKENPRVELKTFVNNQSIAKDFLEVQNFDFNSVGKTKIYDAYELDERTQPFLLSEKLSNVDESILKAALKCKNLGTSLLKKRIKDAGQTDTLAFYLPFHQYPADWGIYIPIKGLLKTTKGFKTKFKNKNSIQSLKFAFERLVQHELMHYLVELAVFEAEKQNSTAYYLPAKLNNNPNQKNELQKTEEKLAEAFMLRHFRQNSFFKGKEPTLSGIISTQPGYKDGINAVENIDFENCKKELFIKYSKAIKNPQLAINEVNKLTDFRCPIYLINDADATNTEEKKALTAFYKDLVNKIHSPLDEVSADSYVQGILSTGFDGFDAFDTPDASGKFHNREAFFNKLPEIKWHLDDKYINVDQYIGVLDLKWITFILENHPEWIKDVFMLTEKLKKLINDEKKCKEFIEGIDNVHNQEIIKDMKHKINKTGEANYIAERINHQTNINGEVSDHKKPKQRL